MADESKTAVATDDPGADPFIMDYLKKLNNPNICMVIMRSKNKNIVCYEGKMASDGKTIDPETQLDAYWYDIDPEYTRKRRAKGDMTDRVELGAIERRMAYGFSIKPTAKAGVYEVTLTAFPERVMTMQVVDGAPKFLTTINNEPAYVERIYVATKENFFGMPTVLYVNMYGTRVSDGAAVIEVIKKK
mmetsp:Transcript_42678/g.87117  ORF Transcript_42678/g.87117 Transcript_42678/m.87117 type:complete len:188 (-) Transcript_42678:128-691(-)